MLRFRFILCSFFIVHCFATKANSKNTVDEWWQELFLYHPFSEKWIAGVLLNNFYIAEVGNKDWFAQGVLKYKISHRLAAELMYRQEYSEKNGSWTFEKRPIFRLSGETKIGKFYLRNRQSIEYRIFEFDRDFFRYRTDLRIKPDWQFSVWNLTLYLQKEVFVRSNKLSRIRTYLGVQGKVKKFEPAAYFLIQSKKNNKNHFKHQIIVGIYLGIEI